MLYKGARHGCLPRRTDSSGLRPPRQDGRGAASRSRRTNRPTPPHRGSRARPLWTAAAPPLLGQAHGHSVLSGLAVMTIAATSVRRRRPCWRWGGSCTTTGDVDHRQRGRGNRHAAARRPIYEQSATRCCSSTCGCPPPRPLSGVPQHHHAPPSMPPPSHWPTSRFAQPRRDEFARATPDPVSPCRRGDRGA
jgi:hypothetical protein